MNSILHRYIKIGNGIFFRSKDNISISRGGESFHPKLPTVIDQNRLKILEEKS